MVPHFSHDCRIPEGVFTSPTLKKIVHYLVVQYSTEVTEWIRYVVPI